MKPNKIILPDGSSIETLNDKIIYTAVSGKRTITPTNTVNKVQYDTKTSIPDIKKVATTFTPLNIPLPKVQYDMNSVLKDNVVTTTTPQFKNGGIRVKAFGGKSIIDNTEEKPKYFIGAALAAASLGLGVVNSIMGNNAQQKQIAEQNRVTTMNNNNQVDQRLDAEGVSARNFSVNTPMTSFYANGGKAGIVLPSSNQGIEQKTDDMAVAYGATHAQGGVDMGDVEVEGGGAQGNKPGEVIKQEPDGSQFIFSNRIPYTNNMTFAQAAQQLTDQKQQIEQTIGKKLLTVDKLGVKLNASGNIPQANGNARRIDISKNVVNKLETNKQNIDSQIEQLKQQQLQVGMKMGLYNPDGTPKNTSTAPNIPTQGGEQQEPQMKYGGYHTDVTTGQLVKDADFSNPNAFDNNQFQVAPSSNKNNSLMYPNPNASQGIGTNPIMGNNQVPIMATDTEKGNQGYDAGYTTPTTINTPIQVQQGVDTPDVTPKTDTTDLTNAVKTVNVVNPVKASIGTKVDNFLSSNVGQGALGLANAGLNFMTTLNSAKNLENVKVAQYVPIKNIDTPLANLSASRSEVMQNQKEVSAYAKQNYANPGVANIMMQNAGNKSIEQLSNINQQEQNMNTSIINQNISRQMNTQQANNAGQQQYAQTVASKTIGDIQNRQAVASGLNKDLGTVITDYRKGVSEQRTLDLYSKMNPRSVNNAITLQTNYGVDINKLNALNTNTEKTNMLIQAGVPENEIPTYLYKVKVPDYNLNFGQIGQVNTPISGSTKANPYLTQFTPKK